MLYRNRRAPAVLRYWSLSGRRCGPRTPRRATARPHPDNGRTTSPGIWPAHVAFRQRGAFQLQPHEVALVNAHVIGVGAARPGARPAIMSCDSMRPINEFAMIGSSADSSSRFSRPRAQGAAHIQVADERLVLLQHVIHVPGHFPSSTSALPSAPADPQSGAPAGRLVEIPFQIVRQAAVSSASKGSKSRAESRRRSTISGGREKAGFSEAAMRRLLLYPVHGGVAQLLPDEVRGMKSLPPSPCRPDRTPAQGGIDSAQ